MNPNESQNRTSTSKPGDFELIPAETAALSAITKAEIDTQISTAHAYPRHLQKWTDRNGVIQPGFQEKAVAIVEMDEETAESCIYRRPVGRGRDGKETFAEGMSIRMAEIVAACYGNLRAGAQIVSMTPRQIVARGYAHDLEANNASTSECVEATVKRDGTPYDERMRVVVAKAALAKARRDAIFAVVPRALCKRVESAARAVIVGSKKPLSERRAAVTSWLSKLNIEPARVFAALGVTTVDDMVDEHFLTLTGLKTSMKEGDTTLDEAFPPIVKQKESVKVNADGSAADNVNTTGATPIGHLQNCSLIRKGLEAADVSEVEFLGYLQMNGLAVGKTLNDTNPDVVANVLNNFDGVITAVVALKKPVEKRVEKKPVVEKKEAAAKPAEPTKAAEPVPAQSYNYLKALKGLLKISGVDEDKLIIWTRGVGMTEESLSTLDEVQAMQPAVIVKLHDEWMTISKEVLKAKTGELL